MEEERVVQHCGEVDAAPAGASDLDVLLDRAEQARDMELRIAGELLFRGADELLLANDAEEVRVRVPVADEVERLLAAQSLVAGLQVDPGVAGRPSVVVEVAPVDVHVDASELVDDLDEAQEVDADQVVDRDVRQRLDRLERPQRAAGRVGRVDLVVPDSAAWAVDRDPHVAREREQRDAMGRRVGPDQHHRVRAARSLAVDVAVVGPEDQRDRRACRERRSRAASRRVSAPWSAAPSRMRSRARRGRGHPLRRRRPSPRVRGARRRNRPDAGRCSGLPAAAAGRARSASAHREAAPRGRCHSGPPRARFLFSALFSSVFRYAKAPRRRPPLPQDNHGFG